MKSEVWKIQGLTRRSGFGTVVSSGDGAKKRAVEAHLKQNLTANGLDGQWYVKADKEFDRTSVFYTATSVLKRTQ